LIENRYFSPVEFDINFKKTMKVVAEAVKVPTKPVQSSITVSAVPIVVSKPSLDIKPLQVDTQVPLKSALTQEQRKPHVSLKDLYRRKQEVFEKSNVNVGEIVDTLIRKKNKDHE